MKKFTPYQIKFLAGFVVGGLVVIPLLALRVDANVLDTISRWSASYGGSVTAQEPLPVPQDTLPPVGRSNSASIAPCAAPPPTMAAVPDEELRPSLEQFHPPRDEAPVRTGYRDMRAKILMNIAPNNRMRSLIGRVGYPNRFDDQLDYYQTEDGEIAVKSDKTTDRVTSIQFVR